MSTPTPEKISEFIHAQVAAWNARDKDTFMGLYRGIVPGKLVIEYVGKPVSPDPMAVLEQMWTNTNAIVDIEESVMIVNGTEAACHNINKMPSRGMNIETVELYHFNGDDLHIRYFIKAPS